MATGVVTCAEVSATSSINPNPRVLQKKQKIFIVMATSISVQPNLVLSPFPHRTATQYPLFRRTQFDHKPFLRGSLSVAKYGLRPDPGSSDGVIKELFGLLGRAESLLYTIADAAVSSSDTVTTTKQNSDWLSGITNVMETVLKV